MAPAHTDLYFQSTVKFGALIIIIQTRMLIRNDQADNQLFSQINGSPVEHRISRQAFAPFIRYAIKCSGDQM
jgi:hypothetical protein